MKPPFLMTATGLALPVACADSGAKPSSSTARAGIATEALGRTAQRTDQMPRRARRFHALYAFLTEAAYPELPARHAVPDHLLDDVFVRPTSRPIRVPRRFSWLLIPSVLTGHFFSERPHS